MKPFTMWAIAAATTVTVAYFAVQPKKPITVAVAVGGRTNPSKILKDKDFTNIESTAHSVVMEPHGWRPVAIDSGRIEVSPTKWKRVKHVVCADGKFICGSIVMLGTLKAGVEP